ncbi:hypothetical protein [Clostridium omnivorum]|uniref:DUF5673 domain-containing protein n=1 Tax=Clostridium omnivorum TaxID=1604902 RepID=A0ABQ5N3X7_9CLOT|nr:hypothetical protein [Clostridium sp. E14]GLC29909.1 hypothetical protein bsdE14_13190 [Clostridium sp. E14]
MRFIIKMLMRILDNGIYEEPKHQENGRIILKMNTIYGIVGIFSVIVSIVVTIIAFISGAFSSEDWIYALIFIALFVILGAILILYTRNTRVEADSQEISYTGFSGGSKKIKWKYVKKVKYNKSSKEITVSDGETKIKIHLHYKGLGSLLKLMKENVPERICCETLKELGM